jgi:hypothetical protein
LRDPFSLHIHILAGLAIPSNELMFAV